MYDNGPRPQWEDFKTFENEKFIVQVSRLPLRYPKFSISINARGKDRPMRFLPVEWTGQGVVRVRPVLADLQDLIIEAEGFIERELQKGEDRRIDDMMEREKRNQPRGVAQRPGLKELSKRDKFVREVREAARKAKEA